MSARPGRSAVVTVAVVALLAGGCGKPEVQVPSSLLSAKTVGGTPVAGEEGKVASAGPDDFALLAGAKPSKTAAYVRTRGDHDEIVVIGAWKRSAKLVRTGMDYLSRCLDAKDCHSKPVRFEAERLGGQAGGTVAFSSVFTNQDGERKSIKRSFTFVRPKPIFEGTLVMVSIQRTGNSDPSTQELQRLTRAQVAKTQAQPN